MYLSYSIYNSTSSFILCLVAYEKSPLNWDIIQTKHTLLKFEVRLAILIQGLKQTLNKFDFISSRYNLVNSTMSSSGCLVMVWTDDVGLGNKIILI